jgi:hypothetical protein
MGRYLQGADGRMVGSIGDGKDKTPVAIPAPAQPRTGPQDAAAADRVAAYYEALKNPKPPTGLVALENTSGQIQEFEPGVLTHRVAFFLTSGNCHSFAAALHEETGYPIVIFYSDGTLEDDQDEDDESDHIRHVGVLTPDGYLLDGDGAMKLTTVMERCGWESQVLVGGVGELSETLEIDSIRHGRDWQPLDPEKVASFVSPILETYRPND